MLPFFINNRLFVAVVMMTCCSITIVINDVNLTKNEIKLHKIPLPKLNYVETSQKSLFRRITNRRKDENVEFLKNQATWSDRNALLHTAKEKKEKSLEILNNISNRCKDDRFKIPNVVHYIWFGCDRPFDFYNYLSVLTSIRNMRPCATVVHSDCEPTSDWWKQLTKENKFYVVYQKPPTEVYGIPVTRVHHQADVARLNILMKWGGIYLDDTVLVLRSFNDLRNYSTVLPFQEHGILNNGVILSERNSSFVQLWHKESYSRYKAEAWAYNSCRYPWILWKSHGNLNLHVEMESFLPKWDGWKDVFLGHYPWKDNYAIHLYTNKLKQLPGKRNYPDDVRSMDTSFGEIARMILFNTTNILK